MPFRGDRDAARLKVHRAFQVSANCYDGAPDEDPEGVTVRVHSRLTASGDLPESGLPFAERVEVAPRLVFLIAEHRPVRNNVYAVATSEAYKVIRVEPPDGISITAVCDRLSEAEARQWPSP